MHFNSIKYFSWNFKVGLIEYSIQDGITKQYHAFIKPNPAPLGYRSKCKDEEKEGHRIPYDNFAKANLTDKKIFEDIRNFLQSSEKNNGYLPLFCLNKDIEEAKFGLNYLFDNAAKNKEDCKGIASLKNFLPLENLLIYVASVLKYEISAYSATE